MLFEWVDFLQYNFELIWINPRRYFKLVNYTNGHKLIPLESGFINRY